MSLKSIHFHEHEIAAIAIVTILCAAILYSRNGWWHERTYKDVHQVHSTHVNPTPRLGGVAIFSACAAVVLMHDGYFGDRYAKFFLTMLPLAATCLWEDLIVPTSAAVRLSATVASVILTMIVLEVQLPRLGISVLDPWMGGVLGAAVTILFVTGTVNGFNLIDGLNGLASIVSGSALVAISILSGIVDYEFMVHLSMTLAAAVGAFLIFNFPNARLFLGDTGSYVLGYVVGWFSISIIDRVAEVSPWALFLIVGYPLCELVLTFMRRMLACKSPFRADQEHLHHVVFFAVRDFRKSGGGHKWANPIATILIVPLAIIPMFYALAFYDDMSALLFGGTCYFVIFVSIYYSLKRIYGTKRGLA